MSDVNKVSSAFEAADVGVNRPSTVALAATATTSNVALPASLTPVLNPPSQVRVYNSGTTVVFVAFGVNSGCVAVVPVPGTAGDQEVLPGTERVFGIPQNINYAAAIYAAAGTGTVYFTLGKGQ